VRGGRHKKPLLVGTVKIIIFQTNSAKMTFKNLSSGKNFDFPNENANQTIFSL